MQSKNIKSVQQSDSQRLIQNKKPNENTGYIFSSSVKISDPVTGKVLVQIRCN